MFYNISKGINAMELMIPSTFFVDFVNQKRCNLKPVIFKKSKKNAFAIKNNKSKNLLPSNKKPDYIFYLTSIWIIQP